MFTNDKKLKVWQWVGLCLLVALFLTNSVGAAGSGKATDRHKTVPVPASFTFEGPWLTTLLGAAAQTMQRCNCQNLVSHFTYERLTTGGHRLTIFMDRPNDPGVDTPDTWEIVQFRGNSLHAALREAAKYMRNCGCDVAVRNVMFEPPTTPQIAPASRPVYTVSIVLESPPPN
jgi:hypothetical protein